MKPKKILVVDDSIIFLKAISTKLRSFGYDVFTAVDGSAAVGAVRQMRPDLILLDLNFPPDVGHGGGVAWNGLLILNWLRRMHEAQNTPVIVITAGELEECKQQCVAAGVLDMFEKPVDIEALVVAIRAALHEEELPPGSFQPALPRKRVLFVDDESDWLYMGTLYLSECGYEVFTAHDAQGALRLAAEKKPNVIVLDLNLGDGVGFTLMKLMAVTLPQAQILIYTGKELDEQAILDLKEQGAFECLPKGTMEELLTAVGSAIEASFEEVGEGVAEDDRQPLEDPAAAPIESVLIIEDEVEFGDTLKTFLETFSYCVTRVTDGAEGLRQLAAADFDFVLCDMALPSFTGEEVYHGVESLKPDLCQRFIFMTGHDADPRSDKFVRKVGALMLWETVSPGRYADGI